MRLYKKGDIKYLSSKFRLIFIQISIKRNCDRWKLQIKKKFLWWTWWEDWQSSNYYFPCDQKCFNWIEDAKEFLWNVYQIEL